MSKLLCALSIAFLAACSSSSPEFKAIQKVIGQAGGSVTSSDGKLTITFLAGALIEDCDISIEITAKGYSIQPAFKALLVEAILEYTFDVPQRGSDGAYTVNVPLVLKDGEPVRGTVNSTPELVVFRGFIDSLDELEAQPSGVEVTYDIQPDGPGAATADVNFSATGPVEIREASLGVNSIFQGIFDLRGERGTAASERRIVELEGLPGGSNTIRAETTGRYTSPTIAGFDLSMEWAQEVVIDGVPVSLRIVGWDSGTAPEDFWCLDDVEGYAWTMPGDDPVLGAFSNGVGVFNYSTGAPLGNGTNNFFYSHAFSFGVFPLRLESQLQQASPPVDAMFSFGASGAQLRTWDDALMDFKAPVVFETINTTDGAPYADDPRSGGFTYVSDAGNFVKFLEFDAATGTYEVDDTLTITAADLPNASGAIVSAFRPEATGDVLLVTDGDPGQLWVKTPGQAGAATLIGTVGTAVRRVRTLGDVGVVSAFGSGFGFGSLTFLTKSSGTWALAPSGLIGQRSIGVDLRQLGDGNVAVASCGFLNDTYRITVLAPNGDIVSDQSHDLPAGAEGPGHVIWLPDGGLLVSCNTTNNAVIVPPVSFP